MDMRPLDALNAAKGKRVVVELKDKRRLTGELKAFDIHLNIVLYDTEEYVNGELKSKLGIVFLRGDTIIYVNPAN